MTDFAIKASAAAEAVLDAQDTSSLTNDDMPMLVFTGKCGSELALGPLAVEGKQSLIEFSIDGVRSQLTQLQAVKLAEALDLAIGHAALADQINGVVDLFTGEGVEKLDSDTMRIVTRAELQAQL